MCTCMYVRMCVHMNTYLNARMHARMHVNKHTARLCLFVGSTTLRKCRYVYVHVRMNMRREDPPGHGAHPHMRGLMSHIAPCALFRREVFKLCAKGTTCLFPLWMPFEESKATGYHLTEANCKNGVFCGGGVEPSPVSLPIWRVVWPCSSPHLCWLYTGLASRVLHVVDVVVVVKRIVLCFPDCSDLPSLYGASQLPWGSGSSRGGFQECRW